MLFFTGARAVLFGYTLKTLEDGHGVLMRYAMQQWGGQLPKGIDLSQIILGNLRADIPALRPDHTVGLWGLGIALLRAQTLPKYAHGMRQLWHHPTRHLDKVQQSLYKRLLVSLIDSNPTSAAEKLGGALHTLQDTYTIGHTERENNADPFSPMVRLHYSPSSQHPFISPKDRVWEDEAETTLTPEAQAAVTATVALLPLWATLWPCTESQAHLPLANFINLYLPIKNLVFR